MKRYLGKKILACTACKLREDSKQPVPGIGPANARVMIIGEGPAKQEEILGYPFVGDSGKLLRHVLKQYNIDPKDCYFDNVCHCWGQRNPTPTEQKTCADLFLYKILEKVSPEFVLLVGAPALNAFFPYYKISDVRGQCLEHSSYKNIIFYPVYHPAFVLRKQQYIHVFQVDIDVFSQIVCEGIPEKRLSYKGFGERSPVASNDSEEGRTLNRRTEIKILKK